jgi:hypothetical protein
MKKNIYLLVFITLTPLFLISQIDSIKEKTINIKPNNISDKKWYESIKIDNTIPDVKVTDGRITHFEPGVYVSDVKNYNK